jgi:hypothetical protein
VKNLVDLDYNYRGKIHIFSDEEKLKYCNDLISRHRKIIINNKKFLTEKMEEDFTEIITAAQSEILRLSTTPNNKKVA